MKVSIIIPTHNRPEKLRETIDLLRSQDFPVGDFEIVVVDDGSEPPVAFDPDFTRIPQIRTVRLEGAERSVARNTGAREAAGELLIFVDDDISVKEDFVSAHWQAHLEFGDALAIGAILLPEESQTTPFGRFRQRLEQDGIPRIRGPVADKNFCAAANASMDREHFLKLGGFDTAITSSEDQDLALRHSSEGGRIVFLPEARVIHRDSALDIRSYCKRNEWGSRLMFPFYQRYPEFQQNIERERVNGFERWGREPLNQSFRKVLKSMISSSAAISFFFKISDVLERTVPESRILVRIYRLLLGAHIFRGYRAAMLNER